MSKRFVRAATAATVAVGAGFAAAAVGATASQPAHVDACASHGLVRSGHVFDMAKIKVNPDGTVTPIETPVTRPERGDAYYGTRSGATLEFGGADFKLGADSVFGLDCSGEAGTVKLKEPDIYLDLGSVRVDAPEGLALSVGGNEAVLFNPGGKAMELEATRTLRHGDFNTIAQQGSRAWMFGTLRMTQHGKGYAGITPYLGKERRTNGERHYAHSAVASSYGTVGPYTRGTIEYHGLAPYSPK